MVLGSPLLWPSSISCVCIDLYVCRCHIFFICLSASGHSGCFHVATVINSAAMNGDGGGLVAKSCPTLVTAWTVAHQASLSMGFFRRGLPFPFPRNLSHPGIKTKVSCTAGRFFTD